MTGRQAPHTFTSGGAQVLGLIFKELPTDSADEAEKNGKPARISYIYIRDVYTVTETCHRNSKCYFNKKKVLLNITLEKTHFSLQTSFF